MNQTFLEWVVDTCDRLLASYAIGEDSGIQADCAPVLESGASDPKMNGNSQPAA